MVRLEKNGLTEWLFVKIVARCEACQVSTLKLQWVVYHF